MNLYMILGIVTIALGTYLTYYGFQRSDEKTKKEISEKIEEVRNELKDVKSNATNIVNKSEINKIENEFNEWAKEFSENKKLRKIDFEKIRMESLKKELEYSKYWRPYFENILSMINNLLDAYNANNNTKYIFHSPKLSENTSEKSYLGWVKFSEKHYWAISMTIEKPLSTNVIAPSIILAIENQNLHVSFNEYIHIRYSSKIIDLSHALYPNEENDETHYAKNLNIQNNISGIPDSDVFNDFNLSDYKNKVSETLKTLFEYQIHLLDIKK